MKVVSGEEMKNIDKMAMDKYKIPGVVLMENAGLKVVEEICKSLEKYEKKVVTIVCGTGNNGGDGFVVARHLKNMGIPINLYLLGNPAHIKGDGKINYDIVSKLNIEIGLLTTINILKKFSEHVKRSSIIVDAIFGTGLSRPIDGYIKQVIDIINTYSDEVISIDIPSGICADNGRLCGGAIKASKTVVFHLPKYGNIYYPGKDYCGEVIIKNIGIPKDVESDFNLKGNLITSKYIKNRIKKRNGDTHKGTYGKGYVIAGSVGMTGAAMLTCKGALRSGIGIIRLAISQRLNSILESSLTEVITVPLSETKTGTFSIADIEKIIKTMEDSDVVGIGPGCGKSREIEDLIRNILERTNIPIVIDADGLNALARRKGMLSEIKSPCVMTPHMGEMSRLTDLDIEYIKENKIQVVSEFAKKVNCVVVLKDSKTIIVNPKGEVFINTTGNPGMATAGSGDVLTGIITGLIGQGLSPFEAAVCGVYIHGRAGDFAAQKVSEYGLNATDIVNEIGSVFKELLL
ncbi:MAG: NAD(P)H-hydrate dehydratase [Anaeromicrobium sp.]|jgi:NAD(P)H-hydrate epimerase|uniref:NAD(P)H-hydrate dehydratase n=1 Tax=Anaeromicrobium sp. TaxID=1929132 RepID=UPI0025D8518A|nr:NAD(P)H-hydrate dehydratase [Anaeromicrobium sp.]MCT4595825.1 NAD(P)H-hydrate dehydratase [Anaeromicrobium sp.]